MHPPVAHRPAAVRADLRLLVLVADDGGCVGVDLESGALVRASHPGSARLAPFDVAAAPVAEPSPSDTSRPESVRLEAPPRPVGRLSPRRAERYLRPLLQPKQTHLLGFFGRVVPYWTLAGDRPSLTIVEPEAGPELTRSATGFDCHFFWSRLRHDLPLAHRGLLAVLHRAGSPALSPAALDRVLGYRPGRLLVALTPPLDGYCYKVVAGILPAR